MTFSRSLTIEKNESPAEALGNIDAADLDAGHKKVLDAAVDAIKSLLEDYQSSEADVYFVGWESLGDKLSIGLNIQLTMPLPDTTA